MEERGLLEVSSFFRERKFVVLRMTNFCDKLNFHKFGFSGNAVG